MKVVGLIFWMFFTLVLVGSVIGMFLFVPDTYHSSPSTWMSIGKNSTNSIINNK
jgi:hypothetical protein